MATFLPPLPLFTTVPSSVPPKRPNSHRALHVQNVLSLLHLSLLRQDYPRARRAWRILATCREVGWEGTYRFEGALRRGLVEDEDEEGKEREEWLEGLRRGGGREVIPLLQTYIYHLLALSPPQPTKALDTLEIYITSIPYAASPALHGLAALCALGKSIETPAALGGETTYDHTTAKKYIQTALDLLPEHEPPSHSDDDDEEDDYFQPASARPFYLSLLKLADEISRWGPGGNRVRGRGGGGGGMDESDSSSGSGSEGEGGGGGEKQVRRKKSRTSRSNSAGGEEAGRGEDMEEESGEEEEEGVGEVEGEKRDKRHESLSEGEGMMDLS